MRQFAISPLLLVLLVGVPFYGLSIAQGPGAATTGNESAEAKKLKIVPLVTVKPGEKKELLLSTWCTVGITRGGGFHLTEMRDGKAVGSERKKIYRRDGVVIAVPNFDEAKKFANSSEYEPLKQHNIAAFKVTITAESDAKPGLMEMHLVDATCSGHCKTDFRVIVVER